MVHPVKELFQVHVHHDDAPIGHVFLRLAQGVVRPAPGPEAEARRREGRVQQRFEHLEDRLLHQPIDDRRNAQSALPPYPNRLRDSSPSPIPIIRSAASRSRSSAFGVESIPISSSDSLTGGMPPSP